MMTTSYISSINLWNAPRTGLAHLQTGLAQANAEIATGRHADIGLALGTKVGTALGLRQQGAEIDALKDGNGVASLRLKTSQSALAQMQSAADTLLQNLVGQPVAQRAAVAANAGGQLATLTTALNTAIAGQYVFGGTNSGTAPIADTAIATLRAGIASDFALFFGYAPGSAAAASEAPARVQTFLDTYVAPRFADAAWAGVSSANGAVQSRISLSETVPTGASADAQPFAKLAMAYIVSTDLGLSSFSTAAQTVVTSRMIGLLSEGSGGLVSMQADLGRSQGLITAANTRLDAQKTLLSASVGDLEAVDPAEAKTRVDALTTQIQMSYALTAQLRQLSLVNFL
ncbi:flagellar hook-associated family protein [Methylobacterium radiodurans]|uniref:Flagellin n=1 Tax=Methylobacterium radiodurans TaxID=2202828 RepID=A0A2U8VWX1_9HYPH|nr:flagellar hook-associated family protein [Methylobacterium radiodurans]AWN37636.1 flagellar hook-associated family protein [Methylobacterium radiodurans]